MTRQSLAALALATGLTIPTVAPVAHAAGPQSPPASPVAAGAGARVAEAPRVAAAPVPSAPAAPTGERQELVGVVRLLAADTVEHLQATIAGAGQNPAFTGPSTDHYRLVLQTPGKSYFLHGRTVGPNTRVLATGVVDGDDFHADTLQPLSGTSAVGSLPTTGTTRVLVLLAHWNTPDTVTQASAEAQMFGDTNGWYRDASYAKLGQTGDVTPWMRITGPSGGQCYADRESIMTRAKSAASGLGYDLSSYDNFVLYFPDNSWQTGSDCNDYAGWAYVGSSGTWLHGFIDRRASVHEQGHNYGLWHSHSYLCSNGMTGTCSWSDYGDPFDAMGSSGYVGHFNASQKNVLGWMSGRVDDLSAEGTATLAPISSDAATTVAAKVSVSATRTYWLEYRQPTDFDSALPASATDGVLVHVHDSTIGTPDFAGDDGANLLDVRPGDEGSTTTATLRAGSSWTTPEGLTFSVSSVTSSGAAVSVSSGDTTSPALTARAPVINGTAASVSGNVTATFSEEVLGVSGTSFTLEDAATGALVPATVSRNGSSDQWILDPGADLAPDKKYTATLWGGPALIRDRAGLVFLSTSWTFTTGPPPAVTTRSPAPAATNVSVSANVTATFSEPVTGVTASTFTVRKTGASSPLAAVVSRNGTTNQWIVNPTSALTADTRYTVMLVGSSAAIRDAAGNPVVSTGWTFTTGPAPVVTARSPASGGTKASTTGNVAATFSEPAAGVSATTFTLKRTATGAAVAAAVSRNGTTNQWILNPNATLAADTRYTATLTGGTALIRDAAGNPLATTSWTFTTGPAPTVTARTPASGATGVSRTSNIAASFSEAVSGVSVATFKVRKASTGTVATGVVSRNGTTNQWILNPNTTLAGRTRYTVTLTGGAAAIRDAAGNSLTTTSWSFTTRA